MKEKKEDPKTYRITIRLPQSMGRKIDRIAEEYYVTNSQVIRKAIRMYLEGLFDDLDDEPEEFD